MSQLKVLSQVAATTVVPSEQVCTELGKMCGIMCTCDSELEKTVTREGMTVYSWMKIMNQARMTGDHLLADSVLFHLLNK